MGKILIEERKKHFTVVEWECERFILDFEEDAWEKQ